jgi:hypothetical protein
MRIIEARGNSLKKTRELKNDLDHIEVYAAEGATPDSPKWVVCHYASENDRHPKDYTFTSGSKLLRHIAEAVAVPDGEQESDNDGDE